jgi:hypothetical protein
MTLHNIWSVDSLKGFQLRKDFYALKENTNNPSFIDYFADLGDPRQEDRCDHKLIDIIFISVCAVICGADGFTSTPRANPRSRRSRSCRSGR